MTATPIQQTEAQDSYQILKKNINSCYTVLMASEKYFPAVLATTQAESVRFHLLLIFIVSSFIFATTLTFPKKVRYAKVLFKADFIASNIGLSRTYRKKREGVSPAMEKIAYCL